MENEKQENPDPGFKSVFEFLTYSVSLPERALRSTSAVVGGAIRESASLLVRKLFRTRSRIECLSIRCLISWQTISVA